MPPELLGPASDAGHAFAMVMVDELVRHGVTDAVLSPGSRSTPIALALAADDRVRLHVRIDERSASFLALGLARASGRAVPVLCTSGTAAAHFHAAALEADQAQVPLLMLTADRPPELRGTGANQTIDQPGLYGDTVRWRCDVGVPEARPDAVRYWRSTASRAVLTCLGRVGGSAGPVHLNLPLREPLTPGPDGEGFPFPLDGRADGRPWTAGATGPLTPAIPAEVAARLAAATTGVLVAGDGLDAADVQGLLDFAARRQWPVIAEPHSNGRRGAHALPGSDAVLRDAAFTTAHVPDVVVVAGRVGLSRALLGWLSTCPSVVLDPHGRWPDPTRSAHMVVPVGAGALAQVSGPAAPPEWLRDWLTAAGGAADAVDAVLDAERGLTEPLVARALAAGVPAGAVLVVASSMPIRDLDLTMRPRDGVRVVASRGVSGIDGFVSTAIGVALAHGGRTFALAGDLSLLHDINGLVVRDGHQLDLTLVVVNNDGGGIFSLLPQAAADDAERFERLFGTPHGVDVERLAAAYGVGHRHVSDVDGFAAALADGGNGVRIVEVRTDRAANADLHRRLATAAARAVAGS
jgi:2-succinyl-5-enolpyruvyl-6-hydroxy-3-cyclohexene-1-carboxylate synthase